MKPCLLQLLSTSRQLVAPARLLFPPFGFLYAYSLPSCWNRRWCVGDVLQPHYHLVIGTQLLSQGVICMGALSACMAPSDKPSLIRVQDAGLVTSTTSVNVYPALLHSVTSSVISTDHALSPCSVASSSPVIYTFVRASFRTVNILLLHLHAMPGSTLPRPSLWQRKGLLVLARLQVTPVTAQQQRQTFRRWVQAVLLHTALYSQHRAPRAAPGHKQPEARCGVRPLPLMQP